MLFPLLVSAQTTKPMTLSQAKAKAQMIWGTMGWAKVVKGQRSAPDEVGCTENGVSRLEGAGTSFESAFAAVDPVNGAHQVTVSQNGLTSNPVTFWVCK